MRLPCPPAGCYREGGFRTGIADSAVARFEYTAFMTRRDLGKLAVAMQVRAAQADTPKKYTGALDGFESKLDMAGFDPVVYGRKMHEAAPLQMTFKAQNRRQA